jgi:alpha-beta hydrolase superfamily lysophospholipase
MSYFNTSLVGIERIPQAPAACLIVLHGLAEHCGRYEVPIASVAASGIACFAYDQRGHGRSPGSRADIERFSQYADDFATIRAGISARYPQLPIFLWGHSLGSVVAICSALDQRNLLAGVITTGCPVCAVPGWSSPLPVWGFARKLVAALPTLRVRPGLPVEALSHDAKVQQDYLRDPLVQEKVSVRLLVELGSTCASVLQQAPSIRVPWLAVHGAEDSIAPPQGSQRLVARLGSSDKQLLMQPGLFHEVHNEAEPAASQFRELLSHWIRARTRPLHTDN